jgi:hypothetical protein
MSPFSDLLRRRQHRMPMPAICRPRWGVKTCGGEAMELQFNVE